MTTTLYWWHTSVTRELARLRDECGTAAYNVRGIASNLRMPEGDVRQYLVELEAAGKVRHAEPLWDYAPGDWYALNS